MKAYLITPLLLAASASAPTEVPGTAAPVGVGASADRAVDFVRGGINVFDHLSADQRRDVGACTRSRDVAGGIEAAVAAALANGSGRVVLPGGCYRISRPITLPSNVELAGAAMRATRIMPAGNFPAILAEGTYARGLTGVGVQNLTVVCAGMGNANAMGVRLVYVNRGKLRDLYFNGCRHGLDLYDQWQTTIDNVTVDGVGAEQNQVGVYMGPPTDPANKAPNNAVILSNSTMQNVALYGYQLVFFAGSKFMNDEAMNGKTGWKLCGEAYQISQQACQFGHFYNIVADTTDGPGIVVDQAENANPVNNVMFANVWIGTSALHALYLAGVTYSQFDDVHITSADNGVYLHNSNNVKVSANVAQYNRGNNGSHAAVIDGGADNTLWATNNRSDHPTGYNGIRESGPTSGNAIWGGAAACAPELTLGGKATHGSAQTTRSCQYEVQGRQVRMTFRLALSGPGLAAGNALLQNLPFAAGAGASPDGTASALLANGMKGIGGAIIARTVPGSAGAQLFYQGTQRMMPLTRDNFTASSIISGTIEYSRK
ncbi:hypothetical protein [Novosphingobium olei]|uniref:Pectate lyase superfamily protein domain-containing protein n=1 Tax=Novosphingobium olei TaxID=2728851 RepID=A0A7Y0BL22_9SPHN|nr:hypothetical protein [Novosphingobium olei]NML92238.1 hypothetical protein [Novosphingobium olei]